jgi:uncharacterized iron-regulated membrane protein
MRRTFVYIHRYAGLYMAFFLILAGLTGSVLAFYNELDGWLNPENHQVAIQNKPMLDAFTLREKALAWEPNAQINVVDFNRQPGQVYEAYLSPATNPATSKPYELAYQSLRLNPYTGGLIGSRKDEGYWPLSRRNILPFIYALHYSLALGEVGIWLFGIAALIWTLDCFVAFYLTFPIRPLKSKNHDSFRVENFKTRSFWSRWAIAWKIKWRASTFRLNFDLHRAGGLWTWLMLFVFAWSSVLLNLGQQVYFPVMQQLFEMSDYMNLPVPALEQPRPKPVMDFRTVYRTGQRFMAEQAQRKGFQVLEERSISYDPAKGLYSIAVKSDYDLGEFGITQLWLDGNSGAFVANYLPTGQKAGDTVTYWLQTLHMAKIWGLPYKIFVCLMGLVVTMLSVTGVYIWFKKCRAVNANHNKMKSGVNMPRLKN